MKLWMESYRPQTLQDYVWVDPEMRAIVEGWLAQGALPHCLFSGVQGTGKTSLAYLLFRELKVHNMDVLHVNANRDRQIDALQDKIMTFINSWAMGPSGIKYVLLDEADKMSHLAQGLLRNEMESKADYCRFVMTANYPQKILPAIHSRVQELRFPKLEKNDFAFRLADILDAEKVQYQPEDIDAYVAATYPDLRKCINLAQQYSRDGKLGPIPKDEVVTQDYLLTMFGLFRDGRYLEARKSILGQIQPEQYDDLYRTLYQNLALFGNTESKQEDALLVIRNAMVKHAVIADPEINISAMLIELSRIAKA